MLTNAATWLRDETAAIPPGCLEARTVLETARRGLDRVPAARRDRWEQARLIEALYHPGRYLRLVYAMLEDAATPASRAWPEGQLVALFAPVRLPMSRRGELLAIDGVPVEAYCFPNDRRLRGLRTFTRRDRTLETWAAWLPGGERVDETTLQRKLIRYVPEQKCVVRLRAVWSWGDGESQTRRLAVRCTSAVTCRKLESRYRSVAAAVAQEGYAFGVPGVVGVEASRGLLGLEWLRGQSLVEALGSGNAGEVVHLAVQALRGFHALRIAGTPKLNHRVLVERVQDAVTDLSAVAHDLFEPLSRLRAELPEQLVKMTMGFPVTLHNDLHPDQLIFKRGRVSLLDLDRMAIGGAEVDLANLATQIEMLPLRPDFDVDAETAGRWKGMLLDGWRREGGSELDPVRFHLLAAKTRLDLARGMMRHLRWWWEPFAVECVMRAVTDLDRAVNREGIG